MFARVLKLPAERPTTDGSTVRVPIGMYSQLQGRACFENAFSLQRGFNSTLTAATTTTPRHSERVVRAPSF